MIQIELQKLSHTIPKRTMQNQEKQHQDLIKQDEQDLQHLTAQVKKVQKLKKEYTQQKQQIGSLKNIIYELKSQNQELRSKSKENLHDSGSGSVKVSERKGEQGKLSNMESNSEECQDEYFQNHGQQKTTKEVKIKQKQRKIKEDQDQQQQKMKTRPKIWNATHNRQHNSKKNKKTSTQQLDQLLKDEADQKQQNRPYPQPSLRNHSGFISSAKYLSPQARTYNETWRLKNVLDYSDDTENEYFLTANHMETKTKLFNNLISDLKLQLQQKQSHLQHESASHKHTRKQLKAQQAQNTNLTKINNRIYSSYEILQKQNEFLKQQLLKETENKIKYEAFVGEVVGWHQGRGRGIWEEFEREFGEMDRIYGEFQRIYGYGLRGNSIGRV